MKGNEDKQAQSLTVYLAKSSCSSPETLLKDPNLLRKLDIHFENDCSGQLFIQPGRPKPPRWVAFFQESIDDIRCFGSVSSAAAVLLLNTENKYYALTFGHGRHLLNIDNFEENFGLRVALNSIAENKLRTIDKRTFDSISRHTKEQASRDATALDFGLDIEQDLLRAVTGSPIDPIFGKRMSGMDALHVSVNADIEDLPDLLPLYYDKFLDLSYKKNFPWVDQISEIKNKNLQEDLNKDLFQRINSGKFDKIWMAVPEFIDWENLAGFRYSLIRNKPEYHDVHLEDFLLSVSAGTKIEKELFIKKYVHAIDVEGLKKYKWSAYKCLYGEIDEGSDTYLLSGGKWYRITRDFVNEVNTAYNNIPKFEKTFPQYNDSSENRYNKRVYDAAPLIYALMDGKNISHGGGYSRIEFCDLYTKECDIIHVKRYASSSVLSHLFSQGLVSGELFQTDISFRKKVNKILPKDYRINDIENRPRNQKYRIVFAIISDIPGNLVLPFFSRLNLKHAVRRLEGYGFRVALAKINVSEFLYKRKFYR